MKIKMRQPNTLLLGAILAGAFGNLDGRADHQNPIEGVKVMRTDSKEEKIKAKDELGPHALMVNTALKGALTSIQGLESQLKSVSDPTSQEAMRHAKFYQKDIRNDLNEAFTHEKELQAAIQNFPDVAKSDAYSGLVTAMNDLPGFMQTLVSKLDQKSYLADKDQVTSDLDQFQKRLNTAIDKASGFNKHELKLTSKIG